MGCSIDDSRLTPGRLSWRIVWRVALCSLLLDSRFLLASEEPLVRVKYQVLAEAASPETPPPIQEKSIEGRLKVQAVDGGLLVEDRQGGLWPITVSQAPTTETIAPQYMAMNIEELTASLKAEFGKDFEVVTTPHYLICTNAGQGYGEWCGQLFERLHVGFLQFWTERIPGLEAPDRPLVAIAFASQKEYQAFQLADAGGQVGEAQGYYSARTNRMVLFDLPREEARGRALNIKEIQKLALRNPAAIATVIHEAVHQLSFNIGLQTRYADNPIWFSEGLAMYFETPDLETRTGWRTIGKLNSSRLDQYRAVAKTRPREIRSLISTDDRFRDPQTAIDAYAEAWALHYFLLKTQKDKYNSYLKMLGAKPPLRWNTPEQRIADFETAFGPLADVEREQLRFMNRLRGGR